MKRYFALALAAAAGGLAAMAVSGLYAATVKPVFVVTEIDEIVDADGFKHTFQRKDVRAAVEAMVEDGRYVIRSDNAISLDGPAPKSFVVVSFQNMKKAKSYSESMKEFTAARLKTTKSRSFIVEGL
ncbi:MAG TPA: DUF1330 domain-containing protein [Pseudolabrys sp.]|jgi:uncharacterized protein (DUF1330 family)|nr:DUF1330 domain-containing protein [Pseudolabrys sp.]